MSRCERDAFACALRADGLDTRINFVLPFANKRLASAGRIRSGKELRLKALAVAPPIFLPHIVRKPLARAEVSLVS